MSMTFKVVDKTLGGELIGVSSYVIFYVSQIPFMNFKAREHLLMNGSKVCIM